MRLHPNASPRGCHRSVCWLEHQWLKLCPSSVFNTSNAIELALSRLGVPYVAAFPHHLIELCFDDSLPLPCHCTTDAPGPR